MNMIIYSIYWAFLITACYFDITRLIIPNWISLAILALFFVHAALNGVAPNDIALKLLCGMAFLVAGYILYRFQLFGGGDVKLLASCMTMIGFAHAAPLLIWMSLIGAAIAAGKVTWFVIMHRELDFRTRLRNALAVELPYGVAIAGAAMLTSPVQPFGLAFGISTF